MSIRTLSYHFLALGVAVVLGLTLVSTKILMGYGMGPWSILALRTVIAYGIFILYAPKELFAGSVRNEVLCIVLGLALIPGYYGLQNLALAYGQAVNAGILSCAAPLMVGVAATLFLRVKLHWLMQLGLWSGVTGAFLLYVDNVVLSDFSSSAMWLALAAAFFHAVYSLVLRAMGDIDPLLAVRKALGYGTVAALPFCFDEPSVSFYVFTEPVVIVNIVFLSLGVLAASGWLWLKVVANLSAESVAFYNYLWPVATVIFGIAILGETITYIGIMGAAMIVCGVISAQTGLAKIALFVAKRY